MALTALTPVALAALNASWVTTCNHIQGALAIGNHVGLCPICLNLEHLNLGFAYPFFELICRV
jgi:hypothetical protein